MNLDKDLLDRLIKFRRHLHKHPELSNQELNTQRYISDFLAFSNPDEIIKDIGGYGIAFVFDSGIEGPTVLFRSDMDALPIQESNDFDYASINKGVAHLCGHDGHIAILCGLAALINSTKPKKGRVVLMFQPAEETGEGAERVVKDSKFTSIKPDYSFALHNLPGFKRGAICYKDGPFASASTGMIVNLKGLSSHAAHPEDGNNPDKCIAELIREFNQLSDSKELFKDFALNTIIHIKLGERAFGTTPGHADFMATLRTYLNDDMKTLQSQANKIVERLCNKHDIKYNISLTEEFPASVNNHEAHTIVENAIIYNNFESVKLEFPFRWSEDFGHFSMLSKASIFGIGTGENHPQLHNENYDFPDEIIEKGVLMFYNIYKQIMF